jgi:hypothetical protein
VNPLRDRLPRVVASAAVVGFLLASLPHALSLSWASFVEAWRARGESAAAACRRVRGTAYWNGIEAIRKEIPPDGAFLLAWTGEKGMEVFTRFDLAPRRAVILGKVLPGRGDFVAPLRPALAPAWVVLAKGPGEDPRLVGSDVFFGDFAAFPPGNEDGQIPSNLEEPAEGATVPGQIRISGWCQELGGRPCESIRIWLDGNELVSDRLERYPRPDVEAAVKDIGSCVRAGFRAVHEPGSVEDGEHQLTVFFATADGRFRRFGPRHFVVKAGKRP